MSRLDPRSVILFAVTGCYAGALLPSAPLPTHYDSADCHIEVLDKSPEDARAVDLGKVRIYANMEAIDENWVRETLAGHACGYGANAILPLDEHEATPQRLAQKTGTNYVYYAAEMFKLP
jgi:hypothetical protein